MTTYNCPKCNTEFLSGTQFCTSCGCPLESVCIEEPIGTESNTPKILQNKHGESVFGQAFRLALVLFFASILAVVAKWSGCSNQEKFLGMKLPPSPAEMEAERERSRMNREISRLLEETTNPQTHSPDQIIANAKLGCLYVFYNGIRLEFFPPIRFKEAMPDEMEGKITMSALGRRSDKLPTLEDGNFFLQNTDISQNDWEKIMGETYPTKMTGTTFHSLVDKMNFDIDTIRINSKLVFSTKRSSFMLAKGAKKLPENWKFRLMRLTDEETKKSVFRLLLVFCEEEKMINDNE